MAGRPLYHPRVQAVPIGSQVGTRVRSASFSLDLIATLTAVGIVAAYLALRLVNLNLMPPFLDELIYASKAQGLSTQSALSLIWQGHGPSYFGAEYWIGQIYQPLVPAGRALSVVSGLASVVLLFLIGKRLWNQWVGLTAAALYVLCPFALTYDRLALTESFQAALMLASLYVALVLATERRIVAQALLSGALAVLLSAAMLVKVNSAPVLVWTLLGLAFGGAVMAGPSKQRWSVNWPSWMGAVAAIVVSLLAYRWQYQNPAYTTASLEDYHFHLRDVFVHPFQTWIPRIVNFEIPTLLGYLTVPVIVLLLLAVMALLLMLARAVRDRRWHSRLASPVIAAGAAAASLAVPVFYIDITYPRYFFTAVPPMLLLGAWFINSALTRIAHGQRFEQLTPLVAVVVSAAALPFALTLLSNPAAAPIPEGDRVQLVTGWAGGYGLSDMATSIRAAQSGPNPPTLVALVGTRPLWSYQLSLYLAVDHAGDTSTPPQPTFREVPGDPALLNGADLRLRDRLGVGSDAPLLVFVEGGPDAQARWLAANPGFSLIQTYSGPGMHSFAGYVSATVAP